MQTRRELFKNAAALAALMAGAGLLPGQARADASFNRAAFDAKTMDQMLKALGLGKPVESNLVTLVAPDIAENGAVVPVEASSTAPGLKRLMFLVEKNPAILAACFEMSEAIEPYIKTRVKMGQTCNVYAVAVTADNKILFAQKEVKVTLGGCGG